MYFSLNSSEAPDDGYDHYPRRPSVKYEWSFTALPLLFGSWAKNAYSDGDVVFVHTSQVCEAAERRCASRIVRGEASSGSLPKLSDYADAVKARHASGLQ